MTDFAATRRPQQVGQLIRFWPSPSGWMFLCVSVIERRDFADRRRADRLFGDDAGREMANNA